MERERCEKEMNVRTTSGAKTEMNLTSELKKDRNFQPLMQESTVSLGCT